MPDIWQHSPAPYGPVAIALSGAAAAIARAVGGPADHQLLAAVTVLRIIALLGGVLIAAYAGRLATAVGVQPAAARWLGLLSPLVAVHLVSAAHNDALTAGLMIIPHGWPKVQAGVAATAATALARRGIQPAEPLAIVIIALETIGGLCVALGLFTRFWAVATAVEMAVIAYHHLPKFGWTGPGYEYPLFWGLVMLAIALRGGGPYSLDRKLGREL